MAEEVKYNNTLVSGRADETLTYTKYIKDESSGKSTKELLDEKVNKTDQLGTTQIADKAVTTEKLENESVTTDKLNAASVTTDKVADANITTSKLADSSVETEKINNKAVTTDKLNDGAVDNSKLSPEAVTYDKVKDKAIITEKLNDRAVTTEKVEERAITNPKLGNQSVDGRVVREASLETKHFANESVTTEKIKDGSVTNEKVADDTLGIEKFDPELRKTIQAATGLPDDLSQMIQDVDKSVTQLKEKDTDLQSQINDKQQQITANDGDISLLQTRSTQMEKAIKDISASGGASQASAVTYENTESGLDSVTAQGAIDELASKKFNKENIVQEFGDSEDKVVSQSALPFRYIQNEEFIFAKVDAEDKLLFGIQWDGTPKFGKTSEVEDRLQSQVTLLAEKVAIILGDGDTTNVIDTMNELKKFFADIENTETLAGILTNLENVAKNLDKTTIKDEEGNVLDTPFRIIENEEFLQALVDSDNKVLFGFYRATGEPYYPLNEMYHVIQNKEYFAAWLDADDKVVFGIRRDGEIIGEIHAVNALKKVISQLQSDLTSLQEKVGTIDTNLKELLDVFSLQENPEYMAVEKDADGKVLSATYNDGSHYIHNAKSETIPEEFEHIEDPEGRTEITMDADGKVFGYRDSEGTRHEHKMKVDNLNVDNLNLGSNAQKDVLDFINSQPKIVNVRKWHLPNYGIVNIKQETFFLTANDGYSDKTGIYPIVINEDTQENAQKALTVLQFFVKSTLKDEGNGVYSKLDNSVGLDFYVPSKVTYVNNVPYVISSLTKNELDGTYSVNETSIKVTKITDTPTIGAWSVDKKTEHQCVVDIDFGHYLKGSFYIGVKYQGSSTLYKRKRNFRFTFYKDSGFSKKDKLKIGEMVRTSGFNLKANYTDRSRVKEFIMNRILMDIWEHRENYHNYPWNSENEPYSGATGMIKGFPIRVNIGGKFYGLDIFGLKKDEKNYLLDGDASGMIVSGTRGNANDPNNWTAAKPEDWEDEMNDELTESNKQALTDFFSFINSENFTKDNVPQRMSVIDWIDYFINLQVFLMRDNTCRNMILYTGSDKKIFYPFFYDLDLSWNFNSASSNLDIMTNSYAADMSLWENFRTLYKDEISNRYAYLRGTVLNIDYISTIYQEILFAIPQEDINEEKKKWDAGNVSYMETLINVLNKRFDWLDKEYFKV